MSPDEPKNPAIYLLALFIIYTLALVSVTFMIVLIGDVVISAVLSVIFWVSFTFFFFVILHVMSKRLSLELEKEINEVLEPQSNGGHQ